MRREGPRTPVSSCELTVHERFLPNVPIVKSGAKIFAYKKLTHYRGIRERRKMTKIKIISLAKIEHQTLHRIDRTIKAGFAHNLSRYYIDSLCFLQPNGERRELGE